MARIRASLFVFVPFVLAAALQADDEAGFKPLFDGKTLTGWKGDEKFWRVENGTIVAESTDANPCKENTFLVWDQGEVDDFELRLDFRITGSESANSGIQFRGIQREDGHVIGYQADMDRAGKWMGALYDEATKRTMLASRGQKVIIDAEGQRTVTQAADGDALYREHIRPDDWNSYTIKARGNHITLAINGQTTAELIDGEPAHQDFAGLLALQLHSGPPMKVEFRNVRLKRFPLTDGRKKIVFVAGTPSHAAGDHEHNAGCKLLAAKLNTAAKQNGLPIVATVYTNGWPKDPTAMDNVDAVVSYCDGGARHYLNDRLADFDHLVQSRGIGLCCIHYAVETTKGECGDHFLKWIGGYFEPNWSVNPHWTANFKTLPKHPITRGVEPFEINDEWYFHMRFQPEMKGVTPILSDLPPRETMSRNDGPHSGNPFVREAILERKEPQHVAWAYERPDGKGRGFGFTGGHFHRNWKDDNFRKVVLNAIVWSTGLDVPEQGVATATPTDAEMQANQDPKPPRRQPAPPAKPAEPAKPQASAAPSRTVKPVFESPIVTSQTPGHAVDIDVDITGAKELWLVVTDGGNGFSCDWADWVAPRLVERFTIANVAQTVIKPLTELKWKSATSQWGGVNIDKNANGGPLRVAGQPVSYGIGTHANSVIHYELPKDHTFQRFLAKGGLDNGGTDQAGGKATSVKFHVFTEKPGQDLFQAIARAGAPVAASHESTDAVEQLVVHPDLEVALFASEPMMTNPSAIDVDHLGRVWVCEGINYRAFRNADVIGDHKQGDRILILEDTNGDGKADKSTVFYEGHDVDSAHGILVLPDIKGKGLRAIVSAFDSVFFLIDDDGDLKADRKELLFTGIGGAQHDHGIHAFHFGPDGKLYFNFGNEGKQIKDKDGKPIVDKAGNEVNNSHKPYQEGMVFRCNLDGSEFETLGWNFRNNWEVCVDSFGTLWQSDNDDDGNQGVRINYVMEYGNYGYKDELTGAGWRTPRTNWEATIPERHWHLNDPGVIPNLLQTGAGAPTGICFYEGDALPQVFHGAIIHVDAGPNICRAYPVKAKGAGYVAETVNILDGAANRWFRPSDVCIAPDGSLFVADWYDPGVGGHRMQDAARGRIFHVTAKGQSKDGKPRYTAPKVDVSTLDGAMQALRSPHMTTRYLAWTALHARGAEAIPALDQLFRDKSQPEYLRARAQWLLCKSNTEAGLNAMLNPLKPTDEFTDNLRAVALRAIRQNPEFSKSTLHPQRIAESPVLRRELAISLRGKSSPNADTLWAQLAEHHDLSDRWELEALGIGADGVWDSRLAAWLKRIDGKWNTPAGRNIVWRSRSQQTPQLLAEIITSADTPRDELPRYVRALDFQNREAVQPVLKQLATLQGPEGNTTAFINLEALSRLDGVPIKQHPEYREAIDRVLDANRGTAEFVRIADKFHVTDRFPELLELVRKQPESQTGIDAVQVLLRRNRLDELRAVLEGEDIPAAESLIKSLSLTQTPKAVEVLNGIASNENLPSARRRLAVRSMGATPQGAVALKARVEKNEIDPGLLESVAAALHAAPQAEIKAFAAKRFPIPAGKDSEPLPPIETLSQRAGDSARGGVLFHSTATCAKCHQVGTLGKDVGPNLSEIGKKLTKPALWESILFPSAAISHSYENWLVIDENGQQFTGLLVSETPEAMELKDAQGIVHRVPALSIELKKTQDVSLMPADIQKSLSVADLVDVVEYLTTLKGTSK